MKDEVSLEPEATRSPGRVLANGISAGLALLLVSGLVAAFSGGMESLWGSLLLWLMAPIGAAVAAGTAASSRGGGSGRTIAVALLVLLAVVFVMGLLDYVSIVSTVGFTDGASGGSTGWMWRRHVLVALLAVAGGALLGSLLGRRVVPRPDA